MYWWHEIEDANIRSQRNGDRIGEISFARPTYNLSFWVPQNIFILFFNRATNRFGQNKEFQGELGLPGINNPGLMYFITVGC